MQSPMLGEFMGTMVLVIIGNGVIADVVLKRSKAEGGGWMVISTGWGFAAMAGIFTAMACGSHDANINPAVTLALAFVTHNFSKLLPYIAAQTLGAFVGSVIVWLHFLPHWALTPEPMHKLSCFCSHPAIPNKAANLICELVATTLLVFVGACIVTRPNLPPGLAPFLIAGLVWGLILALAGTTGSSMNPARDLGSRIAHAVLPIAGKGGSDWGYAPISVLGTFGGGLLGALAIHFFLT
jgi:glycerol uptake facilitator protein